MNHQSSFPISRDVLYPGYTEWNPRVSWSSSDPGASRQARGRISQGGLEGIQLSLTIVNLFNSEPTQSDAANSRIVMDPRLRRYILSFSKRF